MFASEEYVDAESDWAETDGYEGPGWYVIDMNGIVAGMFDDMGEASYWLDKSKRIA